MSALTGVSLMSAVTQTSSDTGLPQADSETTPEAPKASPSALAFLQDIDDDEDYKHMLFSDGLVIVSDTGKELGDFSITCEATKYEDGTACFLVHATSHGAIDNVPCGTTITSWVTPKLVTLRQEHHEYVKLENHPLDRKTFIVKENDEYVVNRVVMQGEEEQRNAQTLSEDAMQGFISEGSNLLLQRLLVKKGFPEPFQMLSFDSDANLCPAIYRALESRVQVVEETELDVHGIERTINSVTDLPTSWMCYLTKDGHLTSRVQVCSPVTMKLLKLPKPAEEDEESEKPTFGKKELSWEEDMQLFSRFLDRKDELKNEHVVYMRHHPELKALLADFLQFLLLRKPDDVITFAAEYFSSFSTKMPNNTPYKQSNAPSPFANAPKMKHLAQTR